MGWAAEGAAKAWRHEWRLKDLGRGLKNNEEVGAYSIQGFGLNPLSNSREVGSGLEV